MAATRLHYEVWSLDRGANTMEGEKVDCCGGGEGDCLGGGVRGRIVVGGGEEGGVVRGQRKVRAVRDVGVFVGKYENYVSCYL